MSFIKARPKFVTTHRGFGVCEGRNRNACGCRCVGGCRVVEAGCVALRSLFYGFYFFDA